MFIFQIVQKFTYSAGDAFRDQFGYFTIVIDLNLRVVD